ncbi:hypothetical protein SLA2020_361940 [Shorea laevis]
MKSKAKRQEAPWPPLESRSRCKTGWRRVDAKTGRLPSQSFSSKSEQAELGHHQRLSEGQVLVASPNLKTTPVLFLS